ncbi:DUF4225 domain-containing protein [Erwinia papayae]|uniref:DUF4225 domain-containing protein n=1 Tax=Erwinia papayae TaxID=206499 RepID=A0ABV3N4Z9_9GAMM
MSLSGAVKILNEETAYLRQQQFQLMAGSIVQYAAVEKQQAGRLKKLMLKQVGFVGGGMQVFGGFGVCAASLGLACASFGMPSIIHGANNVYENGHYLIFRKEKAGYARDGYRNVARRLGYSDNDADLVYASVDLSLSFYGMGRLILKPDTFRLFRHINTDFVRGWRNMGYIPLGAEGLSDGFAAYNIYQLRKPEK